jgi:cation diffusion facilitator CzcD-associated flavoprotein CzcO
LAIANKKVVVIGSGATAVTIVPELAVDAEHVTMLQLPTYIAALPNHDKMAAKLKRLFPRKIAYRLIRYKNILYTIVFYNLCKYYQRR